MHDDTADKPKVRQFKPAGCEGKTRFTSRAIAAAVAERIGKRRKGRRTNVYRCTFCHGWHVGQRP
jgi:hypothetical protein